MQISWASIEQNNVFWLQKQCSPCEAHFSKYQNLYKMVVVLIWFLTKICKISFFMLKCFIVRCIRPNSRRFSQNKLVNMKNGPGKKFTLGALVFLATSIHVPRPSELDFLMKMMFFSMKKVLALFESIFNYRKKYWIILGKVRIYVFLVSKLISIISSLNFFFVWNLDFSKLQRSEVFWDHEHLQSFVTT